MPHDVSNSRRPSPLAILPLSCCERGLPRVVSVRAIADSLIVALAHLDAAVFRGPGIAVSGAVHLCCGLYVPVILFSVRLCCGVTVLACGSVTRGEAVRSTGLVQRRPPLIRLREHRERNEAAQVSAARLATSQQLLLMAAAAAARASDDAGSESAPGGVSAPGQEAAAACAGGSESLTVTVTAPPATTRRGLALLRSHLRSCCCLLPVLHERRSRRRAAVGADTLLL